ncbi:hypothetical protein BB559_005759 [Furculomyces boomerangus]|uniref:Uncharacterized protein n=1 Tax=Furculomyces boomerangus TaxID=61424 RepID=A0A2T9Y6V1_9FUNG|nr:hypothetical protein BB559_005759 [Furculomyces boomerangus]
MSSKDSRSHKSNQRHTDQSRSRSSSSKKLKIPPKYNSDNIPEQFQSNTSLYLLNSDINTASNNSPTTKKIFTSPSAIQNSNNSDFIENKPQKHNRQDSQDFSTHSYELYPTNKSIPSTQGSGSTERLAVLGIYKQDSRLHQGPRVQYSSNTNTKHVLSNEHIFDRKSQNVVEIKTKKDISPLLKQDFSNNSSNSSNSSTRLSIHKNSTKNPFSKLERPEFQPNTYGGQKGYKILPSIPVQKNGFGTTDSLFNNPKPKTSPSNEENASLKNTSFANDTSKKELNPESTLGYSGGISNQTKSINQGPLYEKPSVQQKNVPNTVSEDKNHKFTSGNSNLLSNQLGQSLSNPPDDLYNKGSPTPLKQQDDKILPSTQKSPGKFIPKKNRYNTMLIKSPLSLKNNNSHSEKNISNSQSVSLPKDEKFDNIKENDSPSFVNNTTSDNTSRSDILSMTNLLESSSSSQLTADKTQYNAERVNLKNLSENIINDSLHKPKPVYKNTASFKVDVKKYVERWDTKDSQLLPGNSSLTKNLSGSPKSIKTKSVNRIKDETQSKTNQSFNTDPHTGNLKSKTNNQKSNSNKDLNSDKSENRNPFFYENSSDSSSFMRDLLGVYSPSSDITGPEKTKNYSNKKSTNDYFTATSKSDSGKTSDYFSTYSSLPTEDDTRNLSVYVNTSSMDSFSLTNHSNSFKADKNIVFQESNPNPHKKVSTNGKSIKSLNPSIEIKGEPRILKDSDIIASKHGLTQNHNFGKQQNYQSMEIEKTIKSKSSKNISKSTYVNTENTNIVELGTSKQETQNNKLRISKPELGSKNIILPELAQSPTKSYSNQHQNEKLKFDKPQNSQPDYGYAKKRIESWVEDSAKIIDKSVENSLKLQNFYDKVDDEKYKNNKLDFTSKQSLIHSPNLKSPESLSLSNKKSYSIYSPDLSNNESDKRFDLKNASASSSNLVSSRGYEASSSDIHINENSAKHLNRETNTRLATGLNVLQSPIADFSSVSFNKQKSKLSGNETTYKSKYSNKPLFMRPPLGPTGLSVAKSVNPFNTDDNDINSKLTNSVSSLSSWENSSRTRAIWRLRLIKRAQQELKAINESYDIIKNDPSFETNRIETDLNSKVNTKSKSLESRSKPAFSLSQKTNNTIQIGSSPIDSYNYLRNPQTMNMHINYDNFQNQGSRGSSQDEKPSINQSNFAGNDEINQEIINSQNQTSPSNDYINFRNEGILAEPNKHITSSSNNSGYNQSKHISKDKKLDKRFDNNNEDSDSSSNSSINDYINNSFRLDTTSGSFDSKKILLSPLKSLGMATEISSSTSENQAIDNFNNYMLSNQKILGDSFYKTYSPLSESSRYSFRESDFEAIDLKNRNPANQRHKSNRAIQKAKKYAIESELDIGTDFEKVVPMIPLANQITTKKYNSSQNMPLNSFMSVPKNGEKQHPFRIISGPKPYIPQSSFEKPRGRSGDIKNTGDIKYSKYNNSQTSFVPSGYDTTDSIDQWWNRPITKTIKNKKMSKRKAQKENALKSESIKEIKKNNYFTPKIDSFKKTDLQMAFLPKKSEANPRGKKSFRNFLRKIKPIRRFMNVRNINFKSDKELFENLEEENILRNKRSFIPKLVNDNMDVDKVNSIPIQITPDLFKMGDSPKSNRSTNPSSMPIRYQSNNFSNENIIPKQPKTIKSNFGLNKSQTIDNSSKNHYSNEESKNFSDFSKDSHNSDINQKNAPSYPRNSLNSGNSLYDIKSASPEMNSSYHQPQAQSYNNKSSPNQEMKQSSLKMNDTKFDQNFPQNRPPTSFSISQSNKQALALMNKPKTPSSLRFSSNPQNNSSSNKSQNIINYENINFEKSRHNLRIPENFTDNENTQMNLPTKESTNYLSSTSNHLNNSSRDKSIANEAKKTFIDKNPESIQSLNYPTQQSEQSFKITPNELQINLLSSIKTRENNFDSPGKSYEQFKPNSSQLATQGTQGLSKSPQGSIFKVSGQVSPIRSYSNPTENTSKHRILPQTPNKHLTSIISKDQNSKTPTENRKALNHPLQTSPFHPQMKPEYIIPQKPLDQNNIKMHSLSSGSLGVNVSNYPFSSSEKQPNVKNNMKHPDLRNNHSSQHNIQNQNSQNEQNPSNLSNHQNKKLPLSHEAAILATYDASNEVKNLKDDFFSSRASRRNSIKSNINLDRTSTSYDKNSRNSNQVLINDDYNNTSSQKAYDRLSGSMGFSNDINSPLQNLITQTNQANKLVNEPLSNFNDINKNSTNQVNADENVKKSVWLKAKTKLKSIFSIKNKDSNLPKTHNNIFSSNFNANQSLNQGKSQAKQEIYQLQQFDSGKNFGNQNQPTTKDNKENLQTNALSKDPINESLNKSEFEKLNKRFDIIKKSESNELENKSEYTHAKNNANTEIHTINQPDLNTAAGSLNYIPDQQLLNKLNSAPGDYIPTTSNNIFPSHSKYNVEASTSNPNQQLLNKLNSAPGNYIPVSNSNQNKPQNNSKLNESVQENIQTSKPNEQNNVKPNNNKDSGLFSMNTLENLFKVALVSHPHLAPIGTLLGLAGLGSLAAGSSNNNENKINDQANNTTENNSSNHQNGTKKDESSKSSDGFFKKFMKFFLVGIILLVIYLISKTKKSIHPIRGRCKILPLPVGLWFFSSNILGKNVFVPDVGSFVASLRKNIENRLGNSKARRKKENQISEDHYLTQSAQQIGTNVEDIMPNSAKLEFPELDYHLDLLGPARFSKTLKYKRAQESLVDPGVIGTMGPTTNRETKLNIDSLNKNDPRRNSIGKNHLLEHESGNRTEHTEDHGTKLGIFSRVGNFFSKMSYSNPERQGYIKSSDPLPDPNYFDRVDNELETPKDATNLKLNSYSNRVNMFPPFSHIPKFRVEMIMHSPQIILDGVGTSWTFSKSLIVASPLSYFPILRNRVVNIKSAVVKMVGLYFLNDIKQENVPKRSRKVYGPASDRLMIHMINIVDFCQLAALIVGPLGLYYYNTQFNPDNNLQTLQNASVIEKSKYIYPFGNSNTIFNTFFYLCHIGGFMYPDMVTGNLRHGAIVFTVFGCLSMIFIFYWVLLKSSSSLSPPLKPLNFVYYFGDTKINKNTNNQDLDHSSDESAIYKPKANVFSSTGNGWAKSVENTLNSEEFEKALSAAIENKKKHQNELSNINNRNDYNNAQNNTIYQNSFGDSLDNSNPLNSNIKSHIQAIKFKNIKPPQEISPGANPHIDISFEEPEESLNAITYKSGIPNTKYLGVSSSNINNSNKLRYNSLTPKIRSIYHGTTNGIKLFLFGTRKSDKIFRRKFAFIVLYILYIPVLKLGLELLTWHSQYWSVDIFSYLSSNINNLKSTGICYNTLEPSLFKNISPNQPWGSSFNFFYLLLPLCLLVLVLLGIYFPISIKTITFCTTPNVNAVLKSMPYSVLSTTPAGSMLIDNYAKEKHDCTLFNRKYIEKAKHLFNGNTKQNSSSNIDENDQDIKQYYEQVQRVAAVQVYEKMLYKNDTFFPFLYQNFFPDYSADANCWSKPSLTIHSTINNISLARMIVEPINFWRLSIILIIVYISMHLFAKKRPFFDASANLSGLLSRITLFFIAIFSIISWNLIRNGKGFSDVTTDTHNSSLVQSQSFTLVMSILLMSFCFTLLVMIMLAINSLIQANSKVPIPKMLSEHQIYNKENLAEKKVILDEKSKKFSKNVLDNQKTSQSKLLIQNENKIVSLFSYGLDYSKENSRNENLVKKKRENNLGQIGKPNRIQFSPGILTSTSIYDSTLQRLAVERVWQDTWSAIMLASRDNRIPPFYKSLGIAIPDNLENDKLKNNNPDYTQLKLYQYKVSGFKHNNWRYKCKCKQENQIKEVAFGIPQKNAISMYGCVCGLNSLSRDILNGKSKSFYNQDSESDSDDEYLSIESPFHHGGSINIRPPNQVGFLGYSAERHLENLLIMDCISYKEYKNALLDTLFTNYSGSLITPQKQLDFSRTFGKVKRSKQNEIRGTENTASGFSEPYYQVQEQQSELGINQSGIFLNDPLSVAEIQKSISEEFCGPDMYFKPTMQLLNLGFMHDNSHTQNNYLDNINENFLSTKLDSNIQKRLGIPLIFDNTPLGNNTNTFTENERNSNSFGITSGIDGDVYNPNKTRFKIQTWFGKAYYTPFPFMLYFIYDEAPGYVVRIGSTIGMSIYLQQNRNAEIIRRRQIRLALRSLENQILSFSFDGHGLKDLDPRASKSELNNGSNSSISDSSVGSSAAERIQELDPGFTKKTIFRAKLSIIKHHNYSPRKTKDINSIQTVDDLVNTNAGFDLKLDFIDSSKIIVDYNGQTVFQKPIKNLRDRILFAMNSDDKNEGFEDNYNKEFNLKILFKYQIQRNNRLKNSNQSDFDFIPFETYPSEYDTNFKSGNQNQSISQHLNNMKSGNENIPFDSEAVQAATMMVPNSNEKLSLLQKFGNSRIFREDLELVSDEMWDKNKNMYQLMSKIESKILGIDSDYNMTPNLYFMLMENNDTVQKNSEIVLNSFTYWRKSINFDSRNKSYGLSYFFMKTIFSPHPNLSPINPLVSVNSPLLSDLEALQNINLSLEGNELGSKSSVVKKYGYNNTEYEYLPWQTAASKVTNLRAQIAIIESLNTDKSKPGFRNENTENATTPYNENVSKIQDKEEFKYHYPLVLNTSYYNYEQSEIENSERTTIELIDSLPTYHELVYIIKLFEKSPYMKGLCYDHFNDIKGLYERIDAIRPYFHPRDPSITKFNVNNVLKHLGLDNILTAQLDSFKNLENNVGGFTFNCTGNPNGENLEGSISGYKTGLQFGFPRLDEVFQLPYGNNSMGDIRHPKADKNKNIGSMRFKLKENYGNSKSSEQYEPKNRSNIEDGLENVLLTPPPLTSPHPLRFVWYLFWDDFFRRYAPVSSHITKHEVEFNPLYPTSIAYNPMSRKKLEIWLNNRGLYSFEENFSLGKNYGKDENIQGSKMGKRAENREYGYSAPKFSLLNDGILNALYIWLNRIFLEHKHPK